MTTTIAQDNAGITKEPATGKFTDKMLADMRALIGTELRTEASINNEYATRTAILRFCEGIGDDNPLWTQADYAEKTQHGTRRTRITMGCGWVQVEGGPREEVLPGDVVWFPPGVKHWHGATATQGMTHIAISEALDGKTVDWMEKVTDQQYGN